MSIKTSIRIFILIVFVVLISDMFASSKRIKTLENKLEISTNNESILLSQFDSLNSYNRELQLNIEQLEYSNNTTLDKLNKVRKELNVKDKELQKLQYQLSISNKTDTVIYRDTIFKEGIKLDTLIKDDWYSLNLDLEYPSTIVVNPEFKSEKYVVTSLKKEIKGTPKKCWLGRIFQKKHNVVRVEVVEKSPYIETKEQIFINIIEQ
ncbi:MAG: hypothetical protein MR346_02480 [Clostridium sp.]|nr:hypothetical protein [Clostridium sp.]